MTRYNSWLKKEQECFFAQLTTPANGDTDSSIQFKSNFTGIESSIQGLILIVSDIELLVEKVTGNYIVVYFISLKVCDYLCS